MDPYSVKYLEWFWGPHLRMMAITARIKHISTLSQLANSLVFVRTTEDPVHESSSWEEFPAHMVRKSSLSHSAEQRSLWCFCLKERELSWRPMPGAGSGNTVVTESESRWI